ncbi:hypothetical protein CMMCAS03_00560 [Clavibacter michiganensis subsp. michiganensis]|nr:hypothetical protein CMMCAS03_00560 [Clavibacter michiganensis subsp. michiganensis]
MVQAKIMTSAMPTRSDGIIGTKMSVGETLRAAAARTVGPPHGTMLSVPFARPAVQVSTTGLMPSLR